MSDTSQAFVILELGEDPDARLDKALARVVPEDVELSRSRLTKLIEAGAVSREETGEVVTVLKTRGSAGEAWRVILPKPVELEAAPQNLPIEVIYEDDALIVVNKASGMVVHPAPGSEDGTLVNALLYHCADSLSGVGGAKRPGIVHRIDKDTSGLLVVAKNDAAHQGLARQFKDHSIKRRYVAFVAGAPSAADPRVRGLRGVSFEDGGVIRIATNIERHKHDRKKMAIAMNSGRHAITRARPIEAFGPVAKPIAAKMECWLETGRTHQIRVHMAHIGHGIIGDPVYGGKRRLSMAKLGEDDARLISTFGRQALHAKSLGFIHPISGESVAFESDLPSDLNALEEVLRKI